MSQGNTRSTWQQLLRRGSAVAGLIVVGLIFFLAIFADLLANDRPIATIEQGTLYFPAVFEYDLFQKRDWPQYRRGHPRQFILMPPVPYSPTKVNMLEILSPPGGKHLLGTDNLGMDLLARIIHGSRIALSVGIIAMGIAAVIGISLGALAGFFGGWLDSLISRLIEVVICFPLLFLLLTLLAFLPPSIFNIMVVIGLTGWTSIARLIRGEILKVKNLEYVTAARTLGYGEVRILLRHVIPNAMAPVFVSITFGIAGSILTETALSFLGFGVQPPNPSWGQILSLAREYPNKAYLAIFPGIAIFLAVTGYNMIGEALRDTLDPKLRRQP